MEGLEGSAPPGRICPNAERDASGMEGKVCGLSKQRQCYAKYKHEKQDPILGYLKTINVTLKGWKIPKAKEVSCYLVSRQGRGSFRNPGREKKEM